MYNYKFWLLKNRLSYWTLIKKNLNFSADSLEVVDRVSETQLHVSRQKSEWVANYVPAPKKSHLKIIFYKKDSNRLFSWWALHMVKINASRHHSKLHNLILTRHKIYPIYSQSAIHRFCLKLGRRRQYLDCVRYIHISFCNYRKMCKLHQ